MQDTEDAGRCRFSSSEQEKGEVSLPDTGDKMKKLMLTDGNSMLFRAYYATAYGSSMTTSKGIPTNAVYGFAMMMQKALETEKPDAVLVAFDAGKHTFRHDLYPDYKGGRKPAPDDLVPQFQLVRDYLDAFGIRWIEMPDIEADDLIGTMSRKYPDYNTVIFSSDHDLLQLVDDTTSVLLMKKGISDMDVMTPLKMKEDMGITPLQIIDMKALMGDSSDNIPGIRGIGEKTALKLLAEYGTVENVLAHEGDLKGALQKKIREGHDSAVLSKTLATIRRDVDIDICAEDCVFRPDYASLVRFFEALDMKTLAARYRDLASSGTAGGAVSTAGKMVRRIPVSLYETQYSVFGDDDRSEFMSASLHGLALSNGRESYYISAEDVMKDEQLLAHLQAGEAASFDVKRLLHVLENEGIHALFRDDVMIMASLADSTLTNADRIFGHYGISFETAYEDVYGKPQRPVLTLDPEKQCAYGCERARAFLQILQEAAPVLRRDGEEKLYREIEMPLTLILADMEKEGIRCDVSVLNGIADRTKAEIDALQSRIYEDAGHEFNINSPKQLGEVLFDELGLRTGKKRSTSAENLEKLRGFHPIIERILSYRKLSKIYSTYAEGLKKYIRRDGRIHTIYNQAATQTGRLSSSEPNLQNISVRDEQGREIRKAFLPDENCVLISCDYHQIELRMLAHMADEKALIEAFNEGIDIHTKTAMDVFGVGRDEVTPLMRRQAKTVNFGIVYGISDFGLSEQLGTSVAEARRFIETYYEKYPGIRTYMDGIVKDCEKNGYVTTLLGRRREIPEIHDKNRMIREFGKRAAMNAPIQGSAADLIKLAMIGISAAMKEKNVRSKMILQVHDELIFSVPEEEMEMMRELINDGMIHAMTLKVPLTAECAVGKSWYEAK